MNYMKMNYMKRIISIAFLSAFLWTGCDYLDIVPENDVKSIETVFEQRAQVDNWVATCYRNMAGMADLTSNVAITGADELVGNDIHRQGGGFTAPPIYGFQIGDGLQSALNPISNTWTNTSYYSTIQYCNTFFEHIGNTLNMEQKEKDLWTAEVKAVKAFLYFQQVRKYGPIILLPQTIGVEKSVEEMKLPRSHVDTCFNEIVRLLDEAIKVLPLREEKTAVRQGYFYKESALALKAMVLVYQASPLFNGNPTYASFRNRTGEPLFSMSVDKEKWRRAAEACDEAIRVCRDAGWDLVEGNTGEASPLLNTLKDIEQSVQAPGSKSKEIVFQAKRQYSTMASWMFIFNHTLPAILNPPTSNDKVNKAPSDGSMSPSMKMVEMYYTENGLPIDMDKDWNYDKRYEMGEESGAKYDRIIPKGTRVLNLHLKREPRFYASILGDRMYWRGRILDKPAEIQTPRVIEARKGEYFGTDLSYRNTRANQNLTGYWLIKHVYTDLVVDNYLNNVNAKGDLPFPLIRMAQLYLMSSEAWNEYLDVPDDQVYAGIDRVRTRAGIPDVRKAWSEHSFQPDFATTKIGMREIIRRETNIELAFEGQRFWNLRRWLAADELNEPQMGWNIVADSEAAFYNDYKGPVPVWSLRGFIAPRDYLFPINSQEVMVSGFVQNPGW